jgi:hypothetical protein
MDGWVGGCKSKKQITFAPAASTLAISTAGHAYRRRLQGSRRRHHPLIDPIISLLDATRPSIGHSDDPER